MYKPNVQMHYVSELSVRYTLAFFSGKVQLIDRQNFSVYLFIILYIYRMNIHLSTC
jgi:hypothetical protein